jgi:type III restriction enzyme
LTHLVLTPPEMPHRNAGHTPQEPAALGQSALSRSQHVPRVHRAERLPLSTGDLLTCIAASIAIDHQVFQAGLRQSVKVTRQIVDVFEGSEETESLQARLSDDEIARRAQSVMFDAGYVDPRDLHDALLARLKSEFGHRGIDVDHTGLERALNRIMAAVPHLIRVAARSCAARFKEVFDTASCRSLSNCRLACSGRAAMSMASCRKI